MFNFIVPFRCLALNTAISLCLLQTVFLFAEDDGHGHEAKAKVAETKDDGHGHDKEKEKISLTTDVMKKHGIVLDEVKPGVIYKTIGGPGEILLNEDKIAHISPNVPGVADKIFKSIGDKVSEGEILAVIESSPLGEAKIEYYTSKTKLDLAKLDYERSEKVYKNTQLLLALLKEDLKPSEIIAKTKNHPIGEVKTKLLAAYSQYRQLEAAFSRFEKLQSKDVISVADLELKSKEFESAGAAFHGTLEDVELGMEQIILKSRREFMLAETAMCNAERKLYMLGLTKKDIEEMSKKHLDGKVSSYQLKTPLDGMVIERHISKGEYVTSENNCFTIADLSTVWCDIRVRPKELKDIVKGGKALIKTDAGDFAAKITTVSPVIDDKTRAGFVRVTLDNPGNILKPGLFVEGKIMVSETKANIVVPVEAVQTYEGKDVVFMQSCKENEFVPQAIKRGLTDDINVEIIEGLKTGDKIAVKGTFLIKAEFAKSESAGCSGH